MRTWLKTHKNALIRAFVPLPLLLLSCAKPSEKPEKKLKHAIENQKKALRCLNNDLSGVYVSNSTVPTLILTIYSNCDINLTYKCGQTGKITGFPKNGTATIMIDQEPPQDLVDVCLSKGKHTCNYNASTVDLTLNCDANGNIYWDKD